VTCRLPRCPDGTCFRCQRIKVLAAEQRECALFSIFANWRKRQIHRLLIDLTRKATRIMVQEAELVQELSGVNAQLVKVADEIGGLQASVDVLNQRIVELEAIISGGEATPELVAQVAAVKAQAQIVDDKIPDAPTPV
jgi:hypothetical protein